MEKKDVFKKIRPFLGIIILVTLILLCTIIVFFSTFSALILPLLWIVLTVLHQIKKENKRIAYLWNSVRFSMLAYFSSLLLLLVWTPTKIKELSLMLERRSWFKIFSVGSKLYGVTSVAFACAIIVFVGFLIYYRLFVRKKTKEITQDD